MTLKGKRIFFLSPKFFGYECAIKKSLEARGADVLYCDDRPLNGFWGKAFSRKGKHFIKVAIDKHYKKVWEEINNGGKFDIFFLLNPEAMPMWFLSKIKENYSKTPVILYMWDSFKNRPHSGAYMSLCDNVYSFDPSDCSHDNRIKFLPLFYLNDFARLSSITEPRFDLSFIGTAHSDRYVVVNQIRKILDENGLDYYFYLYLQSKKLFLYNKLTNNNFLHTKLSDFEYKPLPARSIEDIICSSKAILDIHHPLQTGLTIRTLEVLGARRKLITTNANIMDYDFYNPNNILIVDRNNPNIDIDFIKSDFKPLSEDIMNKYSLDGWLNSVLS